MDRMIQANVIATSGRAVEAAGDVDVLLLDKTGTITLGNRQAVELILAPGVEMTELANAAQLASLADETPEGRSIVVLAKEKYGLRGRNIHELGATFESFSAQTRISGINLNGKQIRKGATDAIENFIQQNGSRLPPEVLRTVDEISKLGGTPLVVTEGPRAMGTIYLKDIVKGGIKERFAELRRMGIKPVMITGDNPLTTSAIAAEAGVDDFLAQATPEELIERLRQEKNYLPQQAERALRNFFQKGESARAARVITATNGAAAATGCRGGAQEPGRAFAVGYPRSLAGLRRTLSHHGAVTANRQANDGRIAGRMAGSGG